ncbi:hypothetical protein N7444_012129 [Penicillium canescens]|nr:hypothetical protein N7444_012129 [Penicillium canescens]
MFNHSNISTYQHINISTAPIGLVASVASRHLVIALIHPSSSPPPSSIAQRFLVQSAAVDSLRRVRFPPFLGSCLKGSTLPIYLPLGWTVLERRTLDYDPLGLRQTKPHNTQAE